MRPIITTALRVLLCLFGFLISFSAVLLALGKPPTSMVPILGVLAVPWLLWKMTTTPTQIEKVRKIFSVNHAKAKVICNVLSGPDALLPLTVLSDVHEESKGCFRIVLIGKTKGGKHVAVTVGQVATQESVAKWPPSTFRAASGDNVSLEYSSGRLSESCWKNLVLGLKLVDQGSE